MNRRKRWAIVLSAGLIVGIVTATIIYLVPKTGEKITLIEKSLAKQTDHKQQIQIFQSTTIKDYEIDGFTPADEPAKVGFALLKKHSPTRYEMLRLTRFEKLTKRATDIYIRYVDLRMEKGESVPYLIVLSLNPDLTTIKVTGKDGATATEKVTANPSMTVIELPTEASTVEYLFYDAAGNVIQ